jgi:Na+/proline symporter
VLPIAIGGRLTFPDGTVDGDTFVLTLPMVFKQEFLALFVFVGGLSAATGMVIVAAIALSTMVCNDLVMPTLLRIKVLRLTERGDLSGLLLFIRRASIVLILLLGYAYFRFIGEADALVTIGLVSFAAAAQFAPAIMRHLLEERLACRGAGRPKHGIPGLGLYLAPTVSGPPRLAVDLLHRTRPLRHRLAETL